MARHVHYLLRNAIRLLFVLISWFVDSEVRL
jgi:hypothetical protein